MAISACFSSLLLSVHFSSLLLSLTFSSLLVFLRLLPFAAVGTYIRCQGSLRRFGAADTFAPPWQSD
jgi:hypothetical protein